MLGNARCGLGREADLGCPRATAAGIGVPGVRSRQPDDGFRRGRLCALAVACLVLANCSGPGGLSRIIDPRYGVSTSARIIPPGQPIPKGGGYYRVGEPYTIG